MTSINWSSRIGSYNRVALIPIPNRFVAFCSPEGSRLMSSANVVVAVVLEHYRLCMRMMFRDVPNEIAFPMSSKIAVGTLQLILGVAFDVLV